MKFTSPFTDFGNPHTPFKDQDLIKDPLNNFHNVFLTDKGRRKSTLKGTGNTQSQSAQSGEAIHSMVQAEYAIQGRLAAAELPIVDMPNQMVSKLDIFTKDGEAIEIKTVSLAELTIMRQPRPDHKLQLIYYLNSLDTGEGDLRGVILYVAREAPGVRKAFKVDKDGEATELAGAAVKYMQIRRDGVSESKMTNALRTSLEEYKSPQEYARDYATLAQEARKLRLRELKTQKKKHLTEHTNKHTKVLVNSIF